MRLRKGDIVELGIERAAYGGRGVARVDGLVVFVSGTVPGDRVMARVFKKKKGYAEAHLLELIWPSPDRIPAPCPYSGYCGGCQWQHLIYERQLEYKREHIRESMARIGGLQEILVHDTIPSEKIYGYRNKMEFSFSDRRWLLPDDYEKGESEGDFGLGLHVPGTFYKVIDVDACLLQHATGNRILREVHRSVQNCGVPVYGLKSHKGFWRFLTLRHSAEFDEWMVNIVTSEYREDVVEPLSEALCSSVDNIKTVVNNINSKRAAIASGEREIVLSGDGYIRDRIGPYSFQISANSFFQTNSSGAEKLYKKVMEYAGLKGSEIVLDLYCGTGTIPIFLSNLAKEVIGMEIAESAILDADRNCRANKVNNCRFVLGDIRERLSAIRQRPDVLVIDPPRAGMHKDVLAGVMDMATDRVVYVSCNPTTMARDLGHMIQDYEVVEIQPVDMFPHTYHIEAVAKLVRRKKTRQVIR
ncbi:MAG: 23S rRNA (uracil(1939)-C(5))-methyltransferase RlmD [Deltaproteobacteria bacterium]|nr:23S rRNA (uracil(1939)-C(5))-methyltransferase RlmD [Deltaproteobacteria bacterium]